MQWCSEMAWQYAGTVGRGKQKDMEQETDAFAHFIAFSWK
jgi:hypothetical protein